MREERQIVINTGPIIALTAATGGLDVLKNLYTKVLVPLEVSKEILAGGLNKFAISEFKSASWLTIIEHSMTVPPVLANTLDRGEAAVIHLAITERIHRVCIDETAGRRMARLCGLDVTGSLGVLIRAKREGYITSVKSAIGRMEKRGIWIGVELKHLTLCESGETME